MARDTDVKGLEFRLSASGARAWSAVSQRVGGRQLRFTIPNGASLGLANARKAATKLITQIDGG